MQYSEIAKTQEYNSDKNCCTVVASSIAFNVPFDEMQNYFFQHGRKRNKGYHMYKIVPEIAKDYGYKAERFYKVSNGYYNNKTGERILENTPSLTVNNCTKYLTKGTFILGVHEHVLAVKNGKVEDWTRGRKHRVKYIYRITKTNNVKSLTINKNPFEEFGL
tara:strand:+ start:715 stop:1200 length:486 start_codon:yes stop_codon:yes gene_type:complete